MKYNNILIRTLQIMTTKSKVRTASALRKIWHVLNRSHVVKRQLMVNVLPKEAGCDPICVNTRIGRTSSYPYSSPKRHFT